VTGESDHSVSGRHSSSGSRIPPRADGALRIALNHFPDTIHSLLPPPIAPDVILSGHTHGGQICLPGGVPIIKHTWLPRRLVSGIHRFGDTWLVIGRGFGFAKWQVRTFCPAEVIELRLTSIAQKEARP